MFFILHFAMYTFTYKCMCLSQPFLNEVSKKVFQLVAMFSRPHYQSNVLYYTNNNIALTNMRLLGFILIKSFVPWKWDISLYPKVPRSAVSCPFAGFRICTTSLPSQKLTVLSKICTVYFSVIALCLPISQPIKITRNKLQIWGEESPDAAK